MFLSLYLLQLLSALSRSHPLLPQLPFHLYLSQVRPPRTKSKTINLCLFSNFEIKRDLEPQFSDSNLHLVVNSRAIVDDYFESHLLGTGCSKLEGSCSKIQPQAGVGVVD